MEVEDVRSFTSHILIIKRNRKDSKGLKFLGSNDDMNNGQDGIRTVTTPHVQQLGRRKAKEWRGFGRKQGQKERREARFGQVWEGWPVCLY